MRWLWIALTACLLLVSCSQDGTEAASRPDPSPRQTIELDPADVPDSATGSSGTPDPDVTFAPARVLIDTADGSVIIDAEKAETPEQRSVGLMFRESLGADEGMVFLFFEESAGAFWMKNVTIPLSIAFFDADGTILDIMDMEPCTKEPCELYEPLDDEGGAVTYFGALEVNQGMFEEWGVKVGDRITVTH